MTSPTMTSRSRQPAGDLFAFVLDGARHTHNLSSGWARRKRQLAKGAVADFGDFDRFVLSEAVEACRRRQAMTGYRWAVDHMVPLERGGLHRYDNLQVIPSRLNSIKADRLIYTRPGEWVETLPGATAALL